MAVTIYHNPRCSKSRATLALLQERGIQPEIIEYLQQPPVPAELQRILRLLGKTAAEIMRTGEAEYKDARAAVDAMDEATRIAWLCDNPRVIERPIVITDSAARIGRPPEAVLDII